MTQERTQRYFERKPIALYLIVISNIFSLVLFLQWLANLGMASIDSDWLYYFPVLASLPFALLGIPMFWQVRGIGWIFLILYNILILFNCASYFLTQANKPISNELTMALVALYHAAQIVILCHPKVWDVFANPHSRVWIRANRSKCFCHGFFEHNGRKTGGHLVDISRTGCSFVVTSRLPVGEVVCFCCHQIKIKQIQIIREISSSGGFFYGARFTNNLSNRQIRDITKAATQLHLRDATNSENQVET